MKVGSDTWVVDGSMAADFTSPAIVTPEQGCVLEIWFEWTLAATGLFNIRVSGDGVKYNNLVLDANKVQGTNITHSGANITIAAADVGNVHLILENAARYTKVFFGRTTGSADALDAGYRFVTTRS